MKKSELIDAIAAKGGMTKADAGTALDAVFDVISDELVAGNKVAIPGFGSFEVSERAARQGRNPANGETIQIPASKVVKYKAGKGLKDKVNG